MVAEPWRNCLPIVISDVSWPGIFLADDLCRYAVCTGILLHSKQDFLGKSPSPSLYEPVVLLDGSLQLFSFWLNLFGNDIMEFLI